MTLAQWAHPLSITLPILVGLALVFAPIRLRLARAGSLFLAGAIAGLQTLVCFQAEPGEVIEWNGSWIPSLGSRFHLEGDSLTLLLGATTAWMALAAMAWALACDDHLGTRRLAGTLLFLGGTLAVLSSEDALLFVVGFFVSVAGIGLAGLSHRRRTAYLGRLRAFVSQQLAFGVLIIVLMVVCWTETEAQTGFAGFDFSRLRSLVWYPSQERWLFWGSFVSIWGLAGWFPLHRAWLGLWSEASPSGRLLLVAHAGCLIPLWVSRWLIGLSPASSRDSMILIAVVLTVHLAHCLRRGIVSESWMPGALGAFGVLICLGLSSFDIAAASAAWLGMVHLLVMSVTLFSADPTRRLQWMLWAVTLAGLPGLWGAELLRAVGVAYWPHSAIVASCIVLAWLVIALRLVATPRRIADASANVHGAEPWGHPPAVFSRIALVVGLVFLVVSSFSLAMGKPALLQLTRRSAERVVSERFPGPGTSFLDESE